MDFNAKFNYWKNSLLDLGKRNKLINFKETKRSVVTITYPNIYKLWEKIVEEEKTIYFPNVLDDFEDEYQFELEDYDDDDDDDDDDNDDDDYNDNDSEIKTNQSVKELQKTLRNIRSKSKTSKEELGINTLYIGFGFLEWKEREDSDIEFKSPLVLVPIEIDLESLQSPFTMSILQGNDIIINPALAYKLNTDYGIDINEDITEIDLEEYLKNIKKKIKNTNWEIEEDASIALFSFYKISMYNDLINNKEKIEQSPIMQMIMGNKEYIQDIPDELNEIDFDKNISVKDSYQIMDADSSQLDAIEYAKSGVSFVLQGPPGTGKSQTITNMIAELLSEGKKVLFVSSKMAALDVVYKRLEKAKLGKFCLSLHDPKTNKKEILNQLESVLKLANAKYEINEQANYELEKLQNIKNKLNAYTKELHELRKPLNRSIYQINGELAKLDNVTDLSFTIDNIENVSNENYNSIIYSLEEYVRTVGVNTQSWKSSCWYGIKKIELTNEMRHDISFHLNNLHIKLNSFNNELLKILTELCVKLDISSKNYFEIIELLKKLQVVKLVPINWLDEERLSYVFDKMNSQWEVLNDIDLQKCDIESINNKFHLFEIDEDYSKNLDKIINIKKSENILIKLDELTCEQKNEYFIKLCDFINKYKEIKEELLNFYEKEILEINYKEILKRFKTEYTSPFKIFNKNYKVDKKLFLGLKKEITKNITDNEMLNVIYSLSNIDKLKEDNINNIEIWKKYFVEYYQDFNTNIDNIKEKIEKSNTLLELEKKCEKIIELSSKKITEEEFNELCESKYNFDSVNYQEIIQNIKNIINIYGKCKSLNVDNNILKVLYKQENLEFKLNKLIELLSITYNNILEECTWYNNLFEDENIILEMNSIQLLNKIIECQKGNDILEKYIDYINAKEKCVKLGLDDFITKIENVVIDKKEVILLFKKRFYRLWLDKVEQNCAEILSFRSEIFENYIDEFKKLDKGQYAINKLRILKKIISTFPNFDRLTNGNDEISILKRELNKNKRTMSLRRLFSQISNLILTLKPCLMMSPLSVSIFLDNSEYMFDTVIFDEASQIKTEDAIGAIIRGKQVIIVGDNKQLPPTNFFNVTTSELDEEYDEELEDIGAYESILDEANLLPEKTLLWHYRSKNESLIAFSNAKFYNNKLITFPSNCEKMINNGVEFFYVEEGRYDRGGRKGNALEAKKVAELVFQHFKENPDRSLGVIAFGEVQQYAIENEINKMRLEKPEFESFFIEDKENAFFVKNLENVQGDERDSIIFSVGYAKDTSGKMNMNFGPLSRIGGERRLNVAITRAKYNVKLVSSILPNEIDLERVKTEGPKLLKKYIEYAKEGIEVLQKEISINESNYFDSPFEESVYDFLVKNGYEVCTQVGCSGYRIDMAIKNPSNKDVFSIGIECDGATYHSTRTARERDRLRQEVLESMGWRIYRIWSTDWIKNQEKESKKLLSVIQKSIENSYDEKKKNDEVSDNENNLNYISITQKDEIDKENPYELEIYREYYLNPNNRYITIEKLLDDVINLEYPIHFEEICRRVSLYYSSVAATKKVKELVFRDLCRVKYKYDVDDNFYMPKNAVIRPRCNLAYNNLYMRGPYSSYNDKKIIKYKRPMKNIYIKELALIMRRIEEKSINIDRISLFDETAKVLNTRYITHFDIFEKAYNLMKLL